MCKRKLNKIYWTVCVAVLIIITAFILWYFDDCWCVLSLFFGEKKHLAEVMTYAGAIAGGLILIGNLLTNQKRAEEQQRTNDLTLKFHKLTEKGHLDTRLKDAMTLLANENTTTVLLGIYSLVQIAIEANNNGNSTYVGMIKKILCLALCEHNKKESSTKEQRIVSDTIIDALFRREESLNVFKQIQTSFEDTDLQGVRFHEVELSEAIFINTKLKNSSFWNTKLKNTTFKYSDLAHAEFDFMYENEMDLKNYILNTNFSDAELEGACFIFRNKEEFVLGDIDPDEKTQFTDDKFKKLKKKRMLIYDDDRWGLNETVICERE